MLKYDLTRLSKFSSNSEIKKAGSRNHPLSAHNAHEKYEIKDVLLVVNKKLHITQQ
jgi:hypothetical protein